MEGEAGEGLLCLQPGYADLGRGDHGLQDGLWSLCQFGGVVSSLMCTFDVL
jgi:hypothetical protein